MISLLFWTLAIFGVAGVVLLADVFLPAERWLDEEDEDREVRL